MRALILTLALAACNSSEVPDVNVYIDVLMTEISMDPAVDADGDHFPAALDCDDEDASINPAVEEICDDLETDEDCDGVSDDTDQFTDESTKSQFFFDGDRDGFGDPLEFALFCRSPNPSWISDSSDCDDANPAVNIGVDEIFDEFDNDCDGLLIHGQLTIEDRSYNWDMVPGLQTPMLSLRGTYWSLEPAKIDQMHIVLTGNIQAVHSVHLSYVNTDAAWTQEFTTPNWNDGHVWLYDLNAYGGGGYFLDFYVDVNPNANPGDTLQATLIMNDLVVTGLTSGALYDPLTDITPTVDIVGPVQTVL